MTRLIRLGAATVVLAAIAIGCSAETQPAVLSILATPRGLPDIGGTTSIQVTATDSSGKPGTGNVTLTAATAGNFNGSPTATVALANGVGTADYTCLRSADTLCTGRVRVTAAWTPAGGTEVTATFNVTIGEVDAGTGGGSGGGAGGGTGGGAGGGAGGGGGGTLLPDGGILGAPANVIFVAAAPTKIGLQTASDGGGVIPSQVTSSVLTFKVIDGNGAGLEGFSLSAAVSGAGGARLTSASTVTTKADGTAQFLVASGTEIGTATVRVAGPNGLVVSGSVDIVAAIPSDQGLQIECKEIVLAANESVTPPRSDVDTECRVLLADRYNNPVQIATNVTWTSEAGNIVSPTTSNETTGVALTTFNTAGRYPPLPTTPLAGEPNASGRNPRDMVVTLIATVRGEEQFFDGSGSSNGVKNGKADIGEWWVDLPEPYIDENDNGTHDNTEPFLDTERLDCVSQTIQPKNGRWDPPNGCWDADTLIWRPAHVVYSGGPAVINYGSTPPLSIPNAGFANLNATISDVNFNALDPTGLAFTPSVTGPGTVELRNVNPQARAYYTFGITYETRQISEDATTGALTDQGPCDPTQTTAATRLIRCTRTYSFNSFKSAATSGIDMTFRITNTNPTGTGAVPGALDVDVDARFTSSSFQPFSLTFQ